MLAEGTDVLERVADRLVRREVGGVVLELAGQRGDDGGGAAEVTGEIEAAAQDTASGIRSRARCRGVLAAIRWSPCVARRDNMGACIVGQGARDRDAPAPSRGISRSRRRSWAADRILRPGRRKAWPRVRARTRRRRSVRAAALPATGRARPGAPRRRVDSSRDASHRPSVLRSRSKAKSLFAGRGFSMGTVACRGWLCARTTS
jgi:hypothetical protein